MQIAREYEVPGYRLSDAELFEEVIETAYKEQKQVGDLAEQKAATELQVLLGQMFENAGAESTHRKNRHTSHIDMIISKLQEISDRPTKKSFTRWIRPLAEGEH